MRRVWVPKEKRKSYLGKKGNNCCKKRLNLSRKGARNSSDDCVFSKCFAIHSKKKTTAFADNSAAQSYLKFGLVNNKVFRIVFCSQCKQCTLSKWICLCPAGKVIQFCRFNSESKNWTSWTPIRLGLFLISSFVGFVAGPVESVEQNNLSPGWEVWLPRRGSRILVRGGLWSFDPKGGVPEPKICSK